MENNITFMDRKKTLLTILVILLMLFINIDGRLPLYHQEIKKDTVYMIQPGYYAVAMDTTAEEPDTLIEELVEDVPMSVARLIDKDLILSTEGYPLDASIIRQKIAEEALRRADTNFKFQESYCTERMAYFNIADDWAQIICFKRRDDKYLVFLIRYYDWREGYGIISANYYIYDGENIVPVDNPLKRFDYLADNKDTLYVRYDFCMDKSAYDPTRLKLNTAMQEIENGKAGDIINAEFLWTGRDFIELASDHSLPKCEALLNIWSNAMGQQSELPNQYARTDIDSDGNDEYIFRVNDGTDTKYAIFSYIDGRLSLIAGINGTDRTIKIHHGGFVILQAQDYTRHIKLMASEVEGIYMRQNDKYSFRPGKEGRFEDITSDEFTKATRRARREIPFNSLHWRFWSAEAAK